MSVADELFAEASAKREAKLKADKGDNQGAIKGVEAFLGKALSTLTGGGIDYLEMLRRNIGADEKDKVTVDQVRGDADKLYKDRSGLAFAGDIAGNVAQFAGVGKGINLAARGAQALPWLARGGKAVETAMNAPGIAGGITSGGMTGIGSGLLKEGAYQADRLGSDKTAKEDFNPLGSAARVALEGGLGAAGGGLGGIISNMTGKGQIAKLGREAIPEGDIAAIKAAQAPAAGMGIGPTAAEGKLAGHEALRFAGNPKYNNLASDLEGLTEFASKNATGGRLADEAAGAAARNAKTPGSFASQSQEAGRQSQHAAKMARTIDGKETLDPTAYWAVQGDPALKGLRDRILQEYRDKTAAGLVDQFVSPSAAARQARSINRSDSVEALTRSIPRAGTEAEAAGMRSALEAHSPLFKTANETARTADEFTRLSKSLGRQHANAPPDPSPSFGQSFFGGPATWAKDAAILAKRAAEGGAMKKAGQMNLDEEIADLLRMIGRRRMGQKATQATVSPFTQTLTGNAFD